MADLATLAALQERLRAATGPSLELDNRIHAWLHGDTGFEWTGHYYNCDRGLGYGGDHGQGIAPLTASVDAALALIAKVLPGWRYLVRSPGRDETAFFARVESEDFKAIVWEAGDRVTCDVVAGQEAVGQAATAPLALVLAAVTALIAQEKMNG